jgi:hypothetical protein
MGLHDGKTDHDLLIELCTDMKWMKSVLTGHIKNHFQTFLVVLGCAVSAGVSVALMIFQWLKSE